MEAFKKTSRPRAEVRAKLASGTPIEVWCQDEMRVGQKNKLTYRWARKGSRPRATHDQRTQSTYLFGAVCPERGPAPPSCCRPAIAKPAAPSRRNRNQSYPRGARDRLLDKPAGMAARFSSPEQYRSAAPPHPSTQKHSTNNLHPKPRTTRAPHATHPRQPSPREATVVTQKLDMDVPSQLVALQRRRWSGRQPPERVNDSRPRSFARRIKP